jgi:hypothetical protein
MKLSSSDEASELIFSYEVQPGDEDQDGVEIQDRVYVDDGSIEYANGETLANIQMGSDYKVFIDATQPFIKQVGSPAAQQYFINDEIDFVIYFNEDVIVNGKPRLVLSSSENIVYADYVYGSHTSKLIFRILPDVNLDKIERLALKAEIDMSEGNISDLAGNEANVSFLPPDLTGIEIYPSAPTVVNITLPDKEVFQYGELVDFFMQYDQEVYYKGNPRLLLIVGNQKAYANLVEIFDNSIVSFAYKIDKDHFDDDGIELYSSMDFSEGVIYSNNGVYASPNFIFEGNTNIKVDASCFGEHASPLPDDYNKALEIIIYRLKTLASVKPEQRGCVNLENADLSAIYNDKMFELNMRELNFENVKIAGANLSDLDLAKVDFSKVQGLEAWQLNLAQTLYAIKLPAMDVADLSPYNRNFMYVDFSQVTGLRMDQLEQAETYEGAILPEYLKLEKELESEIKEYDHAR